jgi:hypothetical protein
MLKKIFTYGSITRTDQPVVAEPVDHTPHLPPWGRSSLPRLSNRVYCCDTPWTAPTICVQAFIVTGRIQYILIMNNGSENRMAACKGDGLDEVYRVEGWDSKRDQK